MSIMRKSFLLLCLLFPFSAPAEEVSVKLEQCLQQVESWTKTWVDYHRSLSAADLDFMEKLSDRIVQDYKLQPTGDLDNIRSRVDEKKDDKAKLAYCRKKLAEVNAVNAAWVKEVKDAQKRGEKVPAYALSYMEKAQRRISSIGAPPRTKK